MKSMRIMAVVMVVGLFLVGCSQQDDPLTPQTQTMTNKDGTEMLGLIDIPDGSGFVEGGVGMVGQETGMLDITVPAGATIEMVLLYWMGGSTDDIGDDSINVDGNPVTGALIGDPINFYENMNFRAYRADVTGEGWVVPGANSFEISGFDFDFTGNAHDENNGAGMIVIYDDGNTADLQLRDGLDMAFFKFSPPMDAITPLVFDFDAASADRTAQLVVLAGSVGENRPNQITATTSAGDQSWDDPLGSVDGPLFDSITLDVMIPAGDTSVTINMYSVPSEDPLGASLGVIGTGLSLPYTELCLGDFVWYDDNKNGCQDEGELGAEGVEVNLWVGCPPQEIIATTMTDADGFYEFCGLEPGDYTVQFVAPEGYEFCEQYASACGTDNDSNAGADGITDCVTLVDEDDYTIDAALCQLTYCIGDLVWYDDGDGCYEEGEMGAEGVDVNLWIGCPPVEIIASTMTDADGMYMFCDLEPGDYTVQFVAPDLYEFCEQYASGCGPEYDSNAGADGITDCVTIVDQDDLTIDAALCEIPEEGCTLTIGFWKNHAGFGPQDDVLSQYLPVWLGDAGGSKSYQVTTNGMAVDFLSQNVYGKPSNGITKLYAQMLAAKLNVEAGSSDSDIATYLADADAFLADYNYMDWDGLSDEMKDDVMMWHGAFDDYNNGYIGPGHCDDDDDDYDQVKTLRSSLQ